MQNYRRLLSAEQSADILEPTPAGDATRNIIGKRLVEENRKTWQPVGVHLGTIYHPSPIVVPDGSEQPEDDTFGYRPTAFPGARAPHVWFQTGRSTLDLFGDCFALLNFTDQPTQALEIAAAQRGVPLKVHRIQHAEARALYGKALVLVRPDGHVAWRGDGEPEEPLALIDRARGAA